MPNFSAADLTILLYSVSRCYVIMCKISTTTSSFLLVSTTFIIYTLASCQIPHSFKNLYVQLLTTHFHQNNKNIYVHCSFLQKKPRGSSVRSSANYILSSSRYLPFYLGLVRRFILLKKGLVDDINFQADIIVLYGFCFDALLLILAR